MKNIKNQKIAPKTAVCKFTVLNKKPRFLGLQKQKPYTKPPPYLGVNSENQIGSNYYAM